jgi:hypothetical protein
VRLSKAKRTFKKGYLPNWTEELYTVVECIETRPPVCLVKDDHGEIMEGTFYAEGIQKVIKQGKYPFLNVRLALLSRTLSPGENLHDFVGPFLPYSLLDTVVWLAHVTSEPSVRSRKDIYPTGLKNCLR